MTRRKRPIALDHEGINTVHRMTAEGPTVVPDKLDRWQRRRLVEAAWRCWQAGVTDMDHVSRLGSSLAGCSVDCVREALPAALRAWKVGTLGRRAA